jgi:fructose-1,6-bisphosphatase
MSTVLEYLQRWQKEKQANQKDMVMLSDRLKEAIFCEIAERVNSAKAELNEQLATALNHLNESRELLSQAENKIEDLNAEKQTLTDSSIICFFSPMFVYLLKTAILFCNSL